MSDGYMAILILGWFIASAVVLVGMIAIAKRYRTDFKDFIESHMAAIFVCSLLWPLGALVILANIFSAVIVTGEKCGWTESNADPGTYRTECGDLFFLGDGDVSVTEFSYCPSCGKKIDVELLED